MRPDLTEPSKWAYSARKVNLESEEDLGQKVVGSKPVANKDFS